MRYLDVMFNVASYIIFGERKSKIEPKMVERVARYYMANKEREYLHG